MEKFTSIFCLFVCLFGRLIPYARLITRRGMASRQPFMQGAFSATFGELHLSGIPHEWTSDFLLDELTGVDCPPTPASSTSGAAAKTRQLERQAGRVLRAISVSVVCGQHMLINVGRGGAHGPHSAHQDAESKLQASNTGADVAGTSFSSPSPPPSSSSNLIYQIVSSHANVSNGIVQLTFSAETTCNDLLNTARMGQIFIAENVHLARPRVLRALAEILSLRKMPPGGEDYDHAGKASVLAATATDTMPSQYMCIAVCAGSPLPYEIRELFMMSVQIDNVGVLNHAPMKPQNANRVRTSNGFQKNRTDKLISEFRRLSNMVHVSNRIKLFLDNVLTAVEAHPVIRRGPSRKRLSVSQNKSSTPSSGFDQLSSNSYMGALRVMAAICANEYLLPRHAHALLPDLITHRVQLQMEDHEESGLNSAEYAQMARAVVEDVVRAVPL